MNNQAVQTSNNPFSGSGTVESNNALGASDQQRAIQEVQASLVIAKQFPRDQGKAMDSILKECMRPSLAESAEYAYPRGGQTVTGPSIRLAESIARCWGNIDYGIRELEQSGNTSQIEAYAWDMETNTRARRVFSVKHERYTKNGSKKLSDPRDIYEIAASNGARRMRACILELIPGDVVDSALKQVAVTLQSNIEITPETIKSVVSEFGKFGVDENHISKRFNKKLEALLPAEYLDLRKIFASLRDGMSKPTDWFDINGSVNTQEAAKVESIIEKKDEPKSKLQMEV